MIPKTRVWHHDINDPLDSTKGLIQLAEEYLNPEMIGVEIGSFEGVSTEVLANYCKQVYAIDPWNFDIESRKYNEIPLIKMSLAEQKFDELTSTINNITKLKMTSAEAIVYFEDKSLDFVYIDGAHDRESVMFDFINWKRKIKSKGFLMGHDSGLVLGELAFMNLSVEKIFEDSSWVVRLS